MKKNIALVLLVICNLWLCIVLLSKKNEFESKLSYLQSKSVERCEDQLADTFLKTLKYADSSFELSDSVRMEMLKVFTKKNEYKLFLRLSFPYCESCIYPVIEKIIKCYPKINKDDIVVISAFPDKEYASDFYKNMKSKNLRIINIPNEEFYLDRNSFNGSYLFRMDSTFHHKDLFFTNKCNLFMTEKYIKYISDSK